MMCLLGLFICFLQRSVKSVEYQSFLDFASVDVCLCRSRLRVAVCQRDTKDNSVSLGSCVGPTSSNDPSKPNDRSSPLLCPDSHQGPQISSLSQQPIAKTRFVDLHSKDRRFPQMGETGAPVTLHEQRTRRHGLRTRGRQWSTAKNLLLNYWGSCYSDPMRGLVT